MWIVAIAWMYVVVMMAVAEATSTQGSVLGAVITFVFYGVAPLSLVLYVMGTPGRRRVRLAKEQAEWRAQQEAVRAAAAPEPTAGLTQTDAGDLAPGDLIASERKVP